MRLPHYEVSATRRPLARVRGVRDIGSCNLASVVQLKRVALLSLPGKPRGGGGILNAFVGGPPVCLGFGVQGITFTAVTLRGGGCALLGRFPVARSRSSYKGYSGHCIMLLLFRDMLGWHPAWRQNPRKRPKPKSLTPPTSLKGVQKERWPRVE